MCVYISRRAWGTWKMHLTALEALCHSTLVYIVISRANLPALFKSKVTWPPITFRLLYMCTYTCTWNLDPPRVLYIHTAIYIYYYSSYTLNVRNIGATCAHVYNMCTGAGDVWFFWEREREKRDTNSYLLISDCVLYSRAQRYRAESRKFSPSHSRKTKKFIIARTINARANNEKCVIEQCYITPTPKFFVNKNTS